MSQKDNKGRIATRDDLPPALFRDYNSPVATWREFLPIEPYPWQYALWSACWVYGAEVSMATCNEAGKSAYTVPVLAAAWAAGFPGSQAVITSSSDDQLQEQLWPSLKLIASKRGWKTAGTTVTLPSVDGVLPGSKIICRVTKEGGRFEGYHNRVYPDAEGNPRFCPLLMIFDEAKTIKPPIFLAGERCNAAVSLYISTTGDNTGDFHDSFDDENRVTGAEWQDEWFDFYITWEMCPHLYKDPLTFKKKTALIKKMGRNHPFIKSNLFAEFIEGGTHKVFSEADISAALRAMNEPRQKIGRNRKGFCDFSGGGDELTFGYREGNWIDEIMAWNREGHVAPSDEGKKYARLFKQKGLSSDELFGDNGGLGAGIISEIEKNGFSLTRMNANQKARDKDQYVDRATEMYWEYKQALHDGIIILPNDPIIIKQMKLRRYVMKNTEDNKIRLEPKEEARKKRGEKSPDRLETIVNLVDGMESMPTVMELKRGHVRTGVPAEYFKNIQNGGSNEDSDFGEEWE